MPRQVSAKELGAGRGTPRKPLEHPEDVKMRKEGEQYAKERAGEFCDRYAADLRAVIALYADSRAEEMWWRLRELFWTREWEKTPR